MIIVTGAAGFIGSNLIRDLTSKGIEVIAVDNLTNGKKLKNIFKYPIVNFYDKDDFLSKIKNFEVNDNVEALIHLGASSSTTVWDGKYLLENNYRYSIKLMDWCLQKGIHFIYASSASVYGLGETGFSVSKSIESPINPYAYFKSLFDNYVKNYLNSNKEFQKIVGIRFFNVYGPNEFHKGNMASPIHKFNQQLMNEGSIKLFKAYGGYSDGMHKRDFVYVKDCIKLIYWFLKNQKINGIFNCGTGTTSSFLDVASSLINNFGKGDIKFIDFPDHLKNAYQVYTCADLNDLRKSGYKEEFTSLEKGINDIFNLCDSNFFFK